MEDSVKEWLKRKKEGMENTNKFEDSGISKENIRPKVYEKVEPTKPVEKQEIVIPKETAEPKPIDGPVFPPRPVNTTERRPKVQPGRIEYPMPKPQNIGKRTSKLKGRLLVAICGIVSAIVVFIIYKFFFSA
jgi:hypothetical protein